MTVGASAAHMRAPKGQLRFTQLAVHPGIDLTLRFLAGKRAESLRLARLSHGTVTALGMPTIGAPS
jgi:hypothetical protein